MTAQRYIGRQTTNPTKRVVDALASALPPSWHIFTEVPVLQSLPGFTLVTDADLLLAHPTKGFCFIELKGGRIRRQGSQWQQQDGRTSLWKDIKPMFQATRCQREFVSWLKTAKTKEELKGHYPMRGATEQVPAIARVLFPDSKRPTVGLEQAASAYYWAGEIRELIQDIDTKLPAQPRQLVDMQSLVNALVGDLEPDSSPLTPEAESKIDRTAEVFAAIDSLKSLLHSSGADQQAAFDRLIHEVADSARSDISVEALQQLRSAVTKISDTLSKVQPGSDKLSQLTSDIAEIKQSLTKNHDANSQLAALRDTLQTLERSLDALKKQQGSLSADDELGRRVDQLAKLTRAQRRRNLAATILLVGAFTLFLWVALQERPVIDRAISQPVVSAGIPSEDNTSGLAATDDAVGGAGGSGPGNGGGESVGPDSSDSDGRTPLDANLSDSDVILSTTLPSSTTSLSSTTTSTVAQPTTTSTTTTSTTTTTTVPTTTVPAITYKPLVASQVSAGRWFSCALDQMGKPYCWGDNYSSNLGDGTKVSRAYAMPTLGDLRLTAISSYDRSVCGLDSSGSAYCWGIATTTSSRAPVRVDTSQPFASIHVTARSTCGITRASVAYCWGTDAAPIDFRSWQRSQTPIEFDSSVALGSLSAGFFRGCYVELSGSTSCWPANNNDERPATLPFSHQFVPDSLTGVAADYPIGGHSCARDRSRGWMCWGTNNQGQLGAVDGLRCANATTSCSSIFVNAISVDFATVKAGNDFTCGLRQDGEIWCWGLNNLGQLGRGTSSRTPTATELRQNATPTPITSSLRFSSLAVGSSHACGVSRDTKSVWCWGDNSEGQLGNRSRTNSALPVEVVTRG